MSIDVTKMERKEPIGAEQDDDTNSVLSLEQILQSPNKSFSTKEIIKISFLFNSGRYPRSGFFQTGWVRPELQIHPKTFSG